MSPAFVFFSSHTHILPFTATECMIGDVVKKRGVRPILLKAAACTCKLVPNLAALPTAVPRCEQCEIDEEVLRDTTSGWGHATLDECHEDEDLAIADRELAQVMPGNLLDWEFQNLKIGKIALHDVLLIRKQDHLEFDPDGDAWQDYKRLARACVILALRFRRYIKQHRVRGLMVYNSHYSVNRIPFAIAEQEGIPNFSMHGGASLRYVWETLMFTRGDIDQHKPACVRNWETYYKDRRLNSADVKMLEGHFEELFAGKMAHAYSAPAGSTPCEHLFSKVNPLGNRKVLVAATSSADERFALEQSGIRQIFPPEEYLFPTQTDWLAFLISRMRESSDLSLIIRVHPREFPNKREGVTSTNSDRLRQLLQDLPDNVVVNWPSDGISFYDLLLHADLIVSCWSSVVLESSLFGCPIVLPRNPVKYFEIVADRISSTFDEYWSDIHECAHANWHLSRVIKTQRWLWMVQFASNVSLFGGRTRLLSPLTFLLEWMADRHQLFRRFRVPLPRKVLNRLRAFGAESKVMTRRRINYEGESVVAETLLGSFNPLQDFRDLQRMQSGAYRTNIDGSLDGGQEGRDCLNAVKRFLGLLCKPGVPAPKIDEMIRTAEAAI